MKKLIQVIVVKDEIQKHLFKGGELFDHDDDGPEMELSELIKEFEDMDEDDVKIFNSLQQDKPSDAFKTNDNVGEGKVMGNSGNNKKPHLLSLSGISKNPEVEKDAIFMDKFSELLAASEETSTLFMPIKLSLRGLHSRGRRNVMDRIKRALTKKVSMIEGFIDVHF